MSWNTSVRSALGAMLLRRPSLSALLSAWLLLLSAGPGFVPGTVSGAGLIRKKPPVRRGCLPLPEEILEQMYGRLTVGIMSAFHHALQLEQNPQQQHNASCPFAAWASAASGPRLPVNLLSISPWAYRMSQDSSRYPRSIPEAYCLCRGCLIGPYGQESADFRSVPVFAPAVVLRRNGPCVGGRHTYSEDYISVAVGCTCVPTMEPEPRAPQGNSI
ncbi:interleukin-17D isoform X2 [Boleophthalmus pectinirostris]|uniref:interleukin-17D isoform X2 n=1 Tax=Boleophthalmus pectinirostris TaxID=150288 RepID=UPI0024316877|nr:interleukin-17D isoform X2 [Boleophthalmus pectinirostris]